MSDFYQRQIAMLENAIQVRREQAHRSWMELSDQISIGGDARTVHTQGKLSALCIAVEDLSKLADQVDMLRTRESIPKRVRAPKRIETQVRQLDPSAWRR